MDLKLLECIWHYYFIYHLRTACKKIAQRKTGNWPLHWTVKSSGESALELFITIFISIVMMRIRSDHLEGGLDLGLIDQDRDYSKRISAEDRSEKLLDHSTICLQYFVLFYNIGFYLDFCNWEIKKSNVSVFVIFLDYLFCLYVGLIDGNVLFCRICRLLNCTLRDKRNCIKLIWNHLWILFRSSTALFLRSLA